MSTPNDPFEVLVVEQETEVPAALSRRGDALAEVPAALPWAATARVHGFDFDEQPLLAGLPGLAHEIVVTRTIVPLLRQHIGSTVVVIFDQGDVRRPIVVGVLQEHRSTIPASAVAAPLVSAEVDDQRVVLTAEREIVLRCGEASITLTRAGKVLIKGTYVLSRSSGYNKIKGAAVDIN
jgi:uncharacterized protein DUF6484